MKKNISFMLVVALIIIMFSSVAAAVQANDNSAVAYTSSGEQKVYSNATVEGNFADNRIMVVLSNEASLNFNTYESADFSEIGCAVVNDLSDAVGRRVQAEVETVAAIAESWSVGLDALDTSGIDTYNRVLCLELEKSGKENVLAAIDELMQRDDVVYAGPDYAIYLCAEPNDARYDDEDNWAPGVIDLPEAWDITTGSTEVVVGILDTGIVRWNPDLNGQVDVAKSANFPLAALYREFQLIAMDMERMLLESSVP